MATFRFDPQPSPEEVAAIVAAVQIADTSAGPPVDPGSRGGRPVRGRSPWLEAARQEAVSKQPITDIE